MQVALAARQQRLVCASLTCCSKAPTTIARAPAGKPTYSTCLQIQIHRLKYRYTRKQTQSMLENIGTSTSLLHQHTNLPMPALLSFPLNFWKSIKIFDNLINIAISTQTSSFSPLLRDEYWRKKCCSTFQKKENELVAKLWFYIAAIVSWERPELLNYKAGSARESLWLVLRSVEWLTCI